jgi:tRNA dimethylallyltransferase
VSEARTPAVALVGATASGKSALAHRVARELGDTEIVSVDAMCVYRGMDLATAKATRVEREEVKYHLLDLVEASQEFSVAQFQRAALAAREEIDSRGHRALYVGGTGLYGRVVLDEFEVPGRYPEVRASLEARATGDLAGLYRELQDLDALAASRMEATNERRIVRALEVTIGSGRAFSSFGDGLRTYGSGGVVQIALDVPLDVLDERIERRFRRWMDEGLVEEVDALRATPGGLARTARQALGYREILAHLEDGADLEECVLRAITQSRRLARRQRSWFRRDPRIEWYSDLESAGARLIAVLNGADAVVRD